MATRDEIIRHNIATTVRVWREGGTGWILLPGSRPGTVIAGKIGPRDAEEVIGWYLDQLTAEIVECKQRGEALPEAERSALKHWRENVPHSYSWIACDDGNVLVPINAYDKPISEGYILAAHPLKYADAVGWLMSKTRRRGDFRGHISLYFPASARRVHVATLRFPSGAGLYTAMAAFERLNEAYALKRLSPEDQRRCLLPYGVWTRATGEEVLFNRFYQPIHERSPDGTIIRAANPKEWIKHADQRWFYDDRHSEAEKRRRAEAALRAFGISPRKN